MIQPSTDLRVVAVVHGEDDVSSSDPGGSLIDRSTDSAYWTQELSPDLVEPVEVDSRVRTVEGQDVRERRPFDDVRQILAEDTAAGPIIVSSLSGADPAPLLDEASAALTGGAFAGDVRFTSADPAAVWALDTSVTEGAGALPIDTVAALVDVGSGRTLDVLSVPGTPDGVAGLLHHAERAGPDHASWAGTVLMGGSGSVDVLVSPSPRSSSRSVIVRSTDEDVRTWANDEDAFDALAGAVGEGR